MTSQTVTIVTGTSRGIGEAIVRSLATRPPTVPLLVYAASRKGISLDLKPATNVKVNYLKLDITDSASIRSLYETISRKHDSVDVLINNAGVNLDDRYNPENVRATLDTNVRGTLRMCQTFIPLLSERSRIVNVSSVGSSLQHYNKDIQRRFRDPSMTLEDLEALMQEYQESANRGTETQDGWPSRAYGVSKASTNSLTAVLARMNPGVSINSCCPGWVSTDMGRMVGPHPAKAPEEGAAIPIRLAFKDIGQATGKYWANTTVSGKGEGQIMDW